MKDENKIKLLEQVLYDFNNNFSWQFRRKLEESIKRLQKREKKTHKKWSVLADGLGYMVLIVKQTLRRDDNDRAVIDFIVKPDNTVRKRYHWREGIELDNQGNKELTILKQDLIQFPDTNKVFYTKSFDNKATELSLRERKLR